MERTRGAKAALKHPNTLILGLLQFLFILVILPGTCFAASVVLDWDPSADADLAGYKIYYQVNSSALPFIGTGAAQGSAPIDEGNVTTSTIDGLDPNNSYFFAVTAYNFAGLESVYSNIIEIKETVAPVITVTSPSNNALVNGILSISADASDNVGVTKVKFFVNGVEVAESATSPYSCSWNSSSLAPGVYLLSAKAFDAAGNEAGSGDVSVTVSGDAIPPSLLLTAPANNAAVNGSVVVSVSALDNIGVIRLEIFVDRSLVFTCNQNTASYNWNSAYESNGSHTLIAKAYDAAGNVGQSASVAVTVLNDSAAPVAVQDPAVPEPGPFTLLDAQQALLIASGMSKPTSTEVERLDVAPYVNGYPQPNGKVDTGDVIIVLSILVGKL